jgi:hypothetical protein
VLPALLTLASLPLLARYKDIDARRATPTLSAA